MEFLSRVDLYEVGRQFVLARAKRIEPTQVDVAGSDINVAIGSQSYVAHAVVRQLAEQVNNLLLGGCDTEDAIDRLALDRYQELRKGAAAALGAVIFARATSLAGAGTIPVGTKVATAGNIEYFTTEVCSFGSTTLASQPCAVSAAQAGKDSQVGANAIRRVSQPGLLWDQTLTVNNPLPTAGGEPAETIDVFRERLRSFFIAARRGTVPAIEFGAKSVPGVDSAQATEVFDPDGTAARLVRLFIADSSGIASVALAAKVRAALLEYRAGGITTIIETSTPTIVAIVLALSFDADVDTTALRDQVRGAIVEFVNSLPVNTPLLMGDLYGLLSRYKSQGLIVMTPGTIVAPAGDIYPDPGHTLRTTLSQVTLV
jgi:hypothetical protein